MNEEPYVYFIDNTLQHEVLDTKACIEAIERGYRAWGEQDAAINSRQSCTSIGMTATIDPTASKYLEPIPRVIAGSYR